MRKFFLFIVLALGIPAAVAAQEFPRHQVRAGWGDMFFESLAFPKAARAQGGKGFTGHLFAGYQYQLNKVVSLGGQLDFQAIRMADMDNFDLAVMPTVRFTYLRTPWVELHSGVAVGVLLAFDNKGGAEFSPALDLNFVGIQLGNGPLTAGLDLGMLNALSGGSKIYLLGARLVSVSLNYQF